MQTSTIIDNYDQYKENTIENRRFKHSDIEVLINNLREFKQFRIEKLGESIEGRDINSISIGSGEIDILMWSQMHGDEATATMAIFDILNFLKSEDMAKYKKQLLSKVTLHFVPMLNPDGAEKFTRRNALGVDLNRDAVRLQSPEARILKAIRDKTDAEFGFNLHDQNRSHAAGKSNQPATLSFLAPAFNYEKDINDVRGNAMKLIAMLNRELQQYIPGQIGKYDDEFEPRAFGDNIQKWGTSTILIESGGNRNDREKQEIRKMNFIALILSFEAIASGVYKAENIEDYNQIPFNESLMFDLLVKNATVVKDRVEYKVDIAINNQEVEFNDNREYVLKGVIVEVGDLSIFHGYNEIDVEGYTIERGGILSEEDYAKVNPNEALINGDLYVVSDSAKHFTKYRISKVENYDAVRQNFKIGDTANFLIKKDSKLRYIVLNGFLIDITMPIDENAYGIYVE